MKSLAELIRNTPRDVVTRSRHVNTWDIKVTHGVRKAAKGMIFTGRCHAKTERIFYDIAVELYPPERTVLHDPQSKERPRLFDCPAMDLPVFVKCSCPWFLFHCEVALARVGSSEVDYSNGKKPYITNPKMTPMLCKHLFAAAPIIIRKFQEAADKDPRQSYQYV